MDSTWFRCPNCFLPLEPVEARALGCERGHRFDVSRNDSVTLLPPRAPRTIGDDRAMLQARARLLESGAYAPITQELSTVVQAESTAQSPPAVRLVDFGCGTGHYAAAVRTGLGAGPTLLADRSPDAVKVSRRTLPESTGVVLDLWRPLPIRDETADLALCVFAPRNPPEFARVLRRGGRLAVVVPTPAHLRELRRLGTMLDIPPGKAAEVTSQFGAAGLELRTTSPVTARIRADAEVRSLIVAMGPSAHHVRVDPEGDPWGDEPIEVTLSVEVLLFGRV